MNESIKQILQIAEKAVRENYSASDETDDDTKNFDRNKNSAAIAKQNCLFSLKKNILKFDCEKFIKEVFDCHNECRSRHGFDSLALNQEISLISQQYANQMAKTGRIAHSNNKYMNQDLGENVYSFDFRDPSMTAKKITFDWYNEIFQYKFMGPQHGTGHFTQLIWKSSKQVGFGIAFSANGRAYFVTNYFPCGNIIGKFSENVNQPLF